MPVQVFLNFSRNNGRSKWRVLSKPECWIKVIFGGPKCSIVRKMLWNDCTKLRVIPKWWIYFYLNNLHNMFAWSFYHHYYFRTMTVFRVPVDYLQQKMDNCTWNLNNLILGISNQNFSSSHLTGQWDESLVCCGDHCTDGQHQGRVPSPAQSQLLHNTNYNSLVCTGRPGAMAGYTCPLICKQTREQPTSSETSEQWAQLCQQSVRSNRSDRYHFGHVWNQGTDMNRLLTTGVCFLLTAQHSQSQFGQPTNANPFVDQVCN